jgi:hypothetical protein
MKPADHILREPEEKELDLFSKQMNHKSSLGVRLAIGPDCSTQKFGLRPSHGRLAFGKTSRPPAMVQRRRFPQIVRITTQHDSLLIYVDRICPRVHQGLRIHDSSTLM